MEKNFEVGQNFFFVFFNYRPIQMGSLSVNNSVTNISRLGTFKLLPSTIFPLLRGVKQLQQSLVMIKFYRHFLPGVARVLQPLTDALMGNPKYLDWSPAVAVVFQGAIDTLVAAVSWPWHWTLYCNECFCLQVGRDLQQLFDIHLQPQTFFS